MFPSQQRTMEILNKGAEGDIVSRVCDTFLSVLILLNLVAVCLESVNSFHAQYGYELFLFETVSVVIFVIEYSLRIWSAPANE